MASGLVDGQVGEIDAAAAFELVGTHPGARLVDVRTRAEWSFVGVPDLSGVGKAVVFAEWQRFPDMAVADDFAGLLTAELLRSGASKTDPVLFLCRSGARSLSAARAMSAAGWTDCRNVTGGFEGPLDASKHRGGVDGWKALSLPWIQT